jgi:Exonuclease
MSLKPAKPESSARWTPVTVGRNSIGTVTAMDGSVGSRANQDAYFSADVETDGPIPGRFSMLSFGLVYAGAFDGNAFVPDPSFERTFYTELQPISDSYEQEALDVNGLDRQRLMKSGAPPGEAMTSAAQWVREVAAGRRPILVAYPLSFDWNFIYWYFVAFSATGSPFNHSGCFDLKTAFAAKAGLPIAEAGRDKLLEYFQPHQQHTHHALDDAKEQAELFIQLFTWRGNAGR